MNDKPKALYPSELKDVVKGSSRPNLYKSVVKDDYFYPSFNGTGWDWTFDYDPSNMTNIDVMADVAGPTNYTIKIEEPVKYVFDEPLYIQEIMAHIQNTYKQHYAKGKYQATDVIIDLGHGDGFNVGNAIKYLSRYGKKEGYNKTDLLKALHYIIIQLYVHDKEHLN